MQQQQKPTALYLPLYITTFLASFFLPVMNVWAEKHADLTNYGAQQIANYTIEFFSAFPAEINIAQEKNRNIRQLVQHETLRPQGENFYVFYLDIAENQIEDQAKLIYTLNPLDKDNQRDLALEPRIFFYQVGMLPSTTFNNQQQLWYPNPENQIDDYHIKHPEGTSIKGDDVTIASNDLTAKNGGLVVQAHRGNDGSENLFYHLGQLELNRHGGLDINWHYNSGSGNNDQSFPFASPLTTKGININVSVNNNGLIAFAYLGRGDVVQIAFGTQSTSDPTRINFDTYIDASGEFSASDRIASQGLSISINDFNDFVLVASSSKNNSSYIVGHYDPVNKKVIWGKKNNGYEGDGYYDRYSASLMASLTNAGQVLETHTPKSSDDRLFFNYGRLNASQKRITWEENRNYDTGSRPAIALNEKLQLIDFHRGTSDRNIWFTLGEIQAQRLEGSKLHLNAAARLSPNRGTDKQMDVTLNNQGNFCYIRSNGGSLHQAYLNYRCGHFPESKILKIGASGITDATFSGGYTRSRITDFDKSSLHEIEFIPQVSGRFTVNNVKDTRRAFYVQAGRTYNPWVQADEAGVIDVRFYPDSGLTTRDGSAYMSQIVVYDTSSARPRRSFFPYEWQIDEAAGEDAIKIDLVGLPPNTTCQVSMPILSNNFTTITLTGINGRHKTVDTSDNTDSPPILILDIDTDPAGNGGSLGSYVDDQGLEHNLGEMKVLSCVNN